jgi:hypothetical protein
VSYITVDLVPSVGQRKCGETETVRNGAELFEMFHRFKPSKLVRSGCHRMIPDVLVEVGRLKAVIYSSDRGQRGVPRTYIHFMRMPPTLACDVAGKQLYIIGGRYRIGRRGIEG